MHYDSIDIFIMIYMIKSHYMQVHVQLKSFSRPNILYSNMF
jgi:hypothetical protein